MDKRDLPQYQKKLEEARNTIHGSKNQYARTLLGRIATVTSLGEAGEILHDIRNALSDGNITDTENGALMSLYNYVVVDNNNLIPTLPTKESSATDVFRKRIWSTPNVSQVMQFRNSVTDMMMLDFLTLDEYVELNNEIDRYIQYTLSNGGMK